MKEHLRTLADGMLGRYLELEKAFKWESNLTKHFVALVLTQSEKTVNIELLKNAVDVIKSGTGRFSNFRGINKFMLAGLMIAESDSVDGIFNRILSNEQILKSNGFKQSAHMPMTCYALYKASEGESPNSIAARAFEIYGMMKKNHPFITSSDDYSMSILLARSSCELSRIEEAYNGLHSNGFYKGNELQKLSHILALSEHSITEVVSVCIRLKQLLKENKLNLSATYYAALGLMTLIDIEDPQSTLDCIELSVYLNQQKKFKWLGKGMNVLLASALISNEWIKTNNSDDLSNITIGISIETLMAAQMAMMIAASSASTTAATGV